MAALTEGLAAFAAGEAEAAGAAFTRASEAIGPGSPLDAAAIRFNLALVAEARGDREEALAALQAIGDATFPGVPSKRRSAASTEPARIADEPEGRTAGDRRSSDRHSPPTGGRRDGPHAPGWLGCAPLRPR